jgi:hypothetical protein
LLCIYVDRIDPVTNRSPLAVIDPTDRIPLVVTTSPVMLTAPLVETPQRLDIESETVTSPLVVSPPTDKIPLVVITIPLTATAPLVVIP